MELQRFQDAFLYASKLHETQQRKISGIPYIAHLMGVSSLVMDDGGDTEEAIAALLHDAIEDQGGEATRVEIRRRYGERVVEIVNGCTDAETMPKPPWRERKEKFIQSLAGASSGVIRVCAADKLDNIRSLILLYETMGEGVWEAFKGKKEGTIWYYAEVTKALRAHSDGRLVRALEKAVNDLQLMR